MNPPDLKPTMNPNPKLKFYDLGCGFMTGTGEPGNWKPPITLMTLVLSIPPRSTICNRNTRCIWSSFVPSIRTIPLGNPGSGHPDYEVEPDGSDVFGLCDYGYEESSDSGFRWFSLESPSNPTTLILAASTNEALDASVLDDFARLHDGAAHHAPAPPAVRERLSTPNA